VQGFAFLGTESGYRQSQAPFAFHFICKCNSNLFPNKNLLAGKLLLNNWPPRTFAFHNWFPRFWVLEEPVLSLLVRSGPCFFGAALGFSEQATGTVAQRPLVLRTGFCILIWTFAITNATLTVQIRTTGKRSLVFLFRTFAFH
jgi:hypothetical protein